jgi:hypothetical protein
MQKIIDDFSEETFTYDLLDTYGLPKSSITRLKQKNLSLSKNAGEIFWKKKLFFKASPTGDLYNDIAEQLRKATHILEHKPRRYRSKPFAPDTARLEYLFKLYEKMTAEGKR